MNVLIIIFIGFSFLFLYKRYMPVWGMVKYDLTYTHYSKEDVIILDIRDYQTSCRETKDGTFCIPLPYLNRHFTDLPDKAIILVASSHVEKNLSARILKNKGMRVIGYHLTTDERKECFG
ncbi:hypothetical protein QGM71_15335 [Virgibacillus sp. C22-A2]|uniref:Sulfurtransferase n=1 Tax=Virgibacillus tibetensis TaxID=3042313 RepID=A0ABU6KHR7_9BACI|nr:hypothetical protein [Virgibacillus sp. C22-A2]